MWTRQHKKRKSGALIVPAIAAAFLSYFGYHAFQGEFGIYASYAFDERIEVLEAELEAVRQRRRDLEHRVALLRDGTLEKDMLDEHARRALNLAHENEIVIYRTRRN
ncbi:MAG: septum formation initiator family protein [Rhizobiaceae bacterium]|nr:septum formation initiator family protein [Rhizobiaceae bacterium]